MPTTHASPSTQSVTRLVELASRAPSVHNTQPWRSDPQGRNLLISCGTALHHALVATAALGWDTEVERFPEEPASSPLARLILRPASPRGRPDQQLQHLAGAAVAGGAHAVPLIDVSTRFHTELLVDRATERQASDDQIVSEQRSWVDHTTVDGIPSGLLLAERPATATGGPARFPDGLLVDWGREVESDDGLILFVAGADEPASWLAAGEGPSAM